MSAPFRTGCNAVRAHCPASPKSRCLLSSFTRTSARKKAATTSSIQSDILATPIDSMLPAAATTVMERPTVNFQSTKPAPIGFHSHKPRDPNRAKLGKTLRVLQDRLPTLLQSPLPQDILSPNITLQLFPSTHPHLPTVSGRVAYNAALWTSPIAWNRVPIIGNVKLEILAERVTSEPLTFLPRHPEAIPEQLVVRWCEKCRGPEGSVGGIARSLRLARGVERDKAFTGLFIFDFDKEGRILTHTIEQVQESSDGEKGMGAKFVGLTDWLLGGMRSPGDTSLPAFAKSRRGSS